MVTTYVTARTAQESSPVWSGRVTLVAKPGDSHTGIGRYAQMLHRGLAEVGVDVERITPSVPRLPASSYSFLRRQGVDLHTFLMHYPIWANYPGTEIYHLISQNLATLLLFRQPQGKAIVTVHDIIPYMMRNDLQMRTYRTLADQLFDHIAMTSLRRADHLIAVSEYTKHCIVEHLGIAPMKITVVYAGIDHTRFQPLPIPVKVHKRYKLSVGWRYLIYVGSEDPRKNLVTLIHALAELRRELPDVELIKVGSAHFNRERQGLIELAARVGVHSAIHFLDDVPEVDLPLLYNLAEVCVMPSLYEGFGFPLLEAMACGTPVVYANATSLPEIGGDAGLLFEPGPAAAHHLASTILRVLTNEDLRQDMRRKGLTRAATFDWSRTVRQMLDVYDIEKTDPNV